MADAAPPLADERAIVQAFQALIQERDALGASVIERREEAAEHDLVLRTLEPLDGGRRCHRLVGDVLVARSVADVLPAVHTNLDNLLAVSWCRRMLHHCMRPCQPVP